MEAFSKILDEELTDQNILLSTYGPVDQDDTTLTATLGRSINDFDRTGDTSWDNIEMIDGVTVGDRSELTYEEMKVEVAGIGDLVSDGFSTLNYD